MKSVVMVGGGIQESKAVGIIQDMGYRVIVTDMNGKAPAFEKADVPVNIDARDVQSLIAWILLNKDHLNISGIFTLINQAPTVAIVASATALPTISIEVVMNCDNKVLMKRNFKKHNLPTADYFEIASLKAAEKAYKKLGRGHMFMKAVDSCGGRGIKKIENLSGIEKAYTEVRQVSKFPVLILEECLSGTFIDAQGIFSDGKFHRGGTADSFFSNDTEEYRQYNPVENFNICPSLQSPAVIENVYSLLETAAKAMGIEWGPIGGDFILTREGDLKIIEIAPRLHGPNGSLQIFPEATGIKPFNFMIQCIVGDEPDIAYVKPTRTKVALCKVILSKKRDIKAIRFKSDPEKLEGLFSWFIYMNNIKSAESKSALSGVASVFVRGDNYKNALDSLKKVESEIEIL
ncbi:MAG: ATP-grasp domain-containing protein [bacterium]